MPKSSNHSALARQWEMLKKIPTRPPGITSSELTHWLSNHGHPVSKRTVERDLNELFRLFGIARNDASIPHGWYWLPGAQNEFASVELTEAVTLTVAEDILRQMLPVSMLEVLESKFALARSKLSAINENAYARWGDKVRYVPTTMTTVPPRVKSALLHRVQEALLKERQVVVQYESFDSGKVRALTLHPLGLIQKGCTPYLVASAFEYKDVRLYALHRMCGVEIATEGVNRPEGFNLDDYIGSGAMEFGSGESITLEAKVSNALGMYLMETPISETQEIVFREEAWVLRASVRDTWQLHFWIMSQGSNIVVVSPEHVVKRVSEEVKSTYNAYLFLITAEASSCDTR